MTAGVRLGGSRHRARSQRVADNYGAGVLRDRRRRRERRSRATRSTATAPSRTASAAAPRAGSSASTCSRAGDDESAGNAPYVTPNDTGDADAGANGLLNFPVLETAVARRRHLTITGWARPGSTIELFLADADPTGFGEGRTYAGTLVEGSGADLDAATGPYSGPVNGLDQGSDNTNRFRFTLRAPAGVAAGQLRSPPPATLAGAARRSSRPAA